MGLSAVGLLASYNKKENNNSTDDVNSKTHGVLLIGVMSISLHSHQSTN